MLIERNQHNVLSFATLEESNYCKTCSALLMRSGEQCLACVERQRVRILEHDYEAMSKRLAQALEAHKTALEKSISLQFVIDDLSKTLTQQWALVRKHSGNWRQVDHECSVLRNHMKKQRSQIQEIVWAVKSFRERGKLAACDHDALLEIIDEPKLKEAKSEPVELPSQTIAPRVGLTNTTIAILYRALTFMSRLVDQKNIVHHCGTEDHGVFVDWVIARAEYASESHSQTLPAPSYSK
jgi:hypothetical protein